jgi:hypothetical protein
MNKDEKENQTMRCLTDSPHHSDIEVSPCQVPTAVSEKQKGSFQDRLKTSDQSDCSDRMKYQNIQF